MISTGSFAFQPASFPSMTNRGDDVIGFRRIFVLFVTLVLLPALLMSGFGVIAIVNVQKADLQRRRERVEHVLRQAEQRFVGSLERGDRVLREGLDAGMVPADVVGAARAGGAPIGGWALLNAVGDVVDGIPPLTTSIAPELKRLAGLSRATGSATAAHVGVEEAGFSGVVSMQRLPAGRTIAYAIDDAALVQSFDGLDDEMRVALRVEQLSEEPVANALQRVMGELVAQDLHGDMEQLVSRRLAAPFSRFTFVVEAPSSSSTTILVVYIVLLSVFLITLITGVVITARLIYQETRLSRLKTDFVSHMSHELRTPLTSIRLFIETLKLGRTSSKEEEQECLDLLAKETERLSEMIERVLGYARLKAGRRVFQQTAVAVDTIVQNAIDAFRAQTLAQARDDGQAVPPRLAFTTEIAAGLPLVHADREALVEALLNLISNAWKYTGPDKRIVVFARAGRRNRVILGVRDNGPGLPKGEHARIFERFYQAKHLLSGKQPGSGLGLAITKAIIEGQGGRIEVDSEPGRGSTFSIELPAAPRLTSTARPEVTP
jgi:signal transduction histidine kinase